MQDTNLGDIAENFVSGDIDFMVSFRENVRMVLEKGMTLQELADKAEMSIDTLRNFVYKNNKDCKLSTAIKIAKAIGVGLDEVIGCNTLSKQDIETLRMIRNIPNVPKRKPNLIVGCFYYEGIGDRNHVNYVSRV